MRLLNTTILKLHEFFTDIPDYVILSHTWGEEEVLFEDIDKPNVSDMAGYAKILKCCTQAWEDGFDWAWVDTCCIDKRSSAELTEAINSMYKWYWEAATCYAYLADVAISSNEHQHVQGSSKTQLHDDLEKSRWFTRGWTLQELLAPVFVEFYAHDWQRLGSRTKLVDRLVRATNIEKRFLLDRELIFGASIATKFSWASLRQTTRAEDMAYCLLGLVDVNMPMLYGEGHKAFYRLQLEVIKHQKDHTIFAWSSQKHHSLISTSTILAPSPAAFETSARFHPIVTHRPAAALTFEMTNNGLRLSLPCIIIGQERIIAIFDCENENGDRLGIWLERSEGDNYRRPSSSDPSPMKARDIDDAESLEFYVEAIAQVPEKKHNVKHMLQFEEPVWICNMSDVEQKVARLKQSSRVYLVEGEFVAILLRTHGEPSDTTVINYHSFLLIVGLHKDYPTLRTARLATWTYSAKNLEYAWARNQYELALENSRYVCDYYRKATCCGNILDVALRKAKGADHICWKAEITIEDLTGNDVYRPSTCHVGMTPDFTFG